jgi:hypothetical protein
MTFFSYFSELLFPEKKNIINNQEMSDEIGNE